MKILVQSFNYFPEDLGGSERSARELARGLAHRGHEVRVVLSDGSPGRAETVDGLPVDILNGLPIGKSPLHKKRHFGQRMSWMLRGEIDPILLKNAISYLKKYPADVIFSNNLAGHGSALMYAARICRIPFVPILRDYGWCCAFGTMMYRGNACKSQCHKCKIFSLSLRWHISRMPAVIAISKHVARNARDILKSDNIEVIYNSISEDFFTQPNGRDGSAPENISFGYIGRIHSTKGINELIEGWRISRAHNMGHKLLIAGSGAEISLPQDSENEGIFFLGPQPAISFLDQLDIMFLPALWAEPFGRTVVEAQARGTYVVGSSKGGIPELISKNGGEILPEISPQAIAKTIRDLIEDPQKFGHVRSAEVQEELQRFTFERMLTNYEEVARRVAYGGVE